MLDEGRVKSKAELARKVGIQGSRVTQLLYLTKLPPEVQTFLLKLDNPKEIRRYSERRLRAKYFGST